MHIGGLAPAGDPRPWVDGELGAVRRAAVMFSGIEGVDGTAWYHPRRLSLDGAAVAGGRANRAQRLLGVRATHGRDLDLPIYAIETSLGSGRVLAGARALARRSGVPRRRLVLVDRHESLRPRRPALRRAAPERLRTDRGAVLAPGRVRPLHRGVSSSRRNGRSPRAR